DDVARLNQRVGHGRDEDAAGGGGPELGVLLGLDGRWGLDPGVAAAMWIAGELLRLFARCVFLGIGGPRHQEQGEDAAPHKPDVECSSGGTTPAHFGGLFLRVALGSSSSSSPLSPEPSSPWPPPPPSPSTWVPLAGPESGPPLGWVEPRSWPRNSSRSANARESWVSVISLSARTTYTGCRL